MTDNKALVIITITIFVATTIFFLAFIFVPLFIKTTAQNQIGTQTIASAFPKLAANQKITKGVLGASVLHISRDVQLDGRAWVNGNLYLSKGSTLHIGDVDVNSLLLNAKNEHISALSQQTPQITQVVNQAGVLSLQNKTGDIELSPGAGIRIAGLTISNTDTGSSQNIFKRIFAGDTSFSAQNNNDVLTFTSTTNQVNVSAATGAITLSLPQNIDITASPGFAGLTLSNFTGANNAVFYATAGTGALATTTTSSSNFCLVSGLSTPTWTACSGVGTNYLQRNNDPGSNINVLAPATIADTLAVGITDPLNFTGFEVDQNSKGNSAAVINQTGSGPIFTASASGIPKFTVNNTGDLIATGAMSGLTGITSSGTITLSGFASNGGPLYTNGTGVLAQTPAGLAAQVLHGGPTPSFGAVSLGSDVSGILGIGNGGMGVTSFNSGDVPFYSGGTTLSSISIGQANTILTSNGVMPQWSNTLSLVGDFSASGTANLSGNVILGTTNATIATNGFFVTSLLPFSALVNLGSSTNMFGTVYAQNIVTPSTGGIDGYWQLIRGLLSPANITNDIAVGGVATGSATPFQVFANTFSTNGGLVPAGTATTSGNLTFRGSSSQVNILNGGTIGYYTSAGGDSGLAVNPALFIAGNGKVGIGTNNPGANALQINGGSLYVNGNSNSIIADGIIRSNTLFWMSNGNSGVSSILRLENFSSNAAAIGLSLSAKLAGTDGTETEWPYQTIIKDTTWTGTAATRNSSITFNTLSNNVSKEVLRMASAGFVGIGSVSPLSTLDVRGQSGTLSVASVSGKTSFAGLVVDNSGNGALFSASSAGQTKFMIDNQGNTRIVSSLCVKANIAANCAGSTAGTIYATNQAIQNADYAENYVSSQQLSPGDIIMPGKDGNNNTVIKTIHTYQSETIGVVSTNPGITLNSNAQTDSKHPNMYPIALGGRVPVIVSTENGPIHTGDFITTSSLPGVGMKATQEGVVIGKALEDFEDSSGKTGKIVVFISVGWANPRIVIGSDGMLQVPTVQTAADTTTTISQSIPSSASYALQSDVASLQSQVASMSSQIQRINDLSDKLSLFEKISQIASDSAPLPLDLYTTEQATVSGNLSVLGRTLLGNVGVTGTVTTGLLTINGLDISNGNPAATINTTGSPLELQSLELAGIDILNGKITIDMKGNMRINASITAKKYTIDTSNAESASAGKAIIPKGKTTVYITTNSLTKDSLIFATPDTMPVAVAKKQMSSDMFALTIPESLSQDLRVDWWIVN